MIDSITIKTINMAERRYDEVGKYVLEISKDGEIRYTKITGFVDLVEDSINIRKNKNEIEEFFNNLERKVKILEWKEDYSVDFCDGWAWEIYINNLNKKKKIIGTIETPKEWIELYSEIRNLIGDVNKDMIGFNHLNNI